ncbi:MAG: hypothetical protein C4532_11760 [Candidatus Abyssobacteria bacterium SURF_17]|jgi:hypothetical protein|uniref:Uncharacterized protein n=1 Tax=Candidatus Abyssobacteria bacterium SURF_17 TaxID=2093361 RepID=A0A419EWH4_9BACT|nr:MAG: hypothetical protein C4532_11760 [Candidatus Abyssubacteria bacterium SURF_17]
MARYDKKSLLKDVDKRRKKLRSLSDDEFKKEFSHVRKLLDMSLPACLRRRTETILKSKNPEKVESEIERFNYEAYWYQLLLDFDKEVWREAKKRKVA